MFVCLACRTFLAMQLIAAKGGVWVLEQPSSSLAFRMRRFQELLGKQKVPQLSHECFFKMYSETVRTMVFSIYLESSTWSYNMHIYIYTIYIIWIPPQFCGSNCKPGTWPQVFRHSFWMRGFGSRTPKRTTIWSNSSAIRFFTTSKKARRVVDRKLADSYVDGAGRKRFKGNANLRKSQYFGYLYDNFVYWSVPYIIMFLRGIGNGLPIFQFHNS